MSVRKLAYDADTCDGQPCCGDCDECEIREEALEHKAYVEESTEPSVLDAYRFDAWRNR